MANPAPTINQINAFNATQGTTIDFNIIGGTELVRSNRIYIYDLSDNSLICTHLYVSTESIHELPPNTDGSIVYESGKSSADFVNGAQYYAQIQTFTDIGGTVGGSGLSVAKMFWCLDDPTLTIGTIPSTISTTSYNVSATYNANTSVVSNIIQQYQFSLYSATGSLLQSSGVVVGNGTQQGTSTAYDISYNFTGLSVGSSYYVVVDVTTTQGMSISAQSSTFTVSIDTPTLGEATVVNNACDGYISVTSNLSSEYGGSGSGEIVSFETDSENVFTKLQVTFSPTQSGSGTPSPSNVRPIYGVGGVEVDRVGKNLFDFEQLAKMGNYPTEVDNGFRFFSDASQYTTGVTLDVPLDNPVTISMDVVNETGKNLRPRVAYTDNTVVSAPTGSGQGDGGHVTFTTTKPIKSILLDWSTAGYFVVTNFQVEYGSVATAYEPYTESTVSQEFDVSLTPTSNDTDPYLFKAVGDIYGDRLEEDIVGGTVNWNQLIQNGKFDDTSKWYVQGGTERSFTVADNIGKITVLSAEGTGRPVITQTTDEPIIGHKYLISFDYKFSKAVGANILYGGYYSLGNLSVNQWGSVQTVINVTAQTYPQFSIYISQYYSAFSVGDTFEYTDIILTDLTAYFCNATIADAIYAMEQANAGAGVAFMRKYFPDVFTADYDAGTLKSVNPTAHKMVGKNLFNKSDYTYIDGYWSGGVITETSGRRIVYMPCLPNTTYTASRKAVTSDERFYLGYTEAIPSGGGSVYGSVATPTSQTVGNKMSITTTTGANAKYLVCWAYWGNHTEALDTLQFELGSTATDYTPYESHTYELGDVTLRGKFELVNGELKAVGDIYKYDGSVQRNWIDKNLNTLTTSVISNLSVDTNTVRVYWSASVGMAPNNTTEANILCDKLTVYPPDYIVSNDVEGISENKHSTYNGLWIRIAKSKLQSNDYAGVIAYLTANEIHVLYQAKTPTTETTDPFEQIQEVSKYGTLEYITTNDVPVGHNTTYLTRDVFGGYIDLPSGLLTVDRISKIPNIGVFSAESSGYSNVNYLQVYKQADSVNINNTTVDGLLTSMFTPEVGSNWDSTDNIGKFLTGATYTQYWIGFPKSATLEQAQATVAGLQICYKLATPLTYQLTPKQIQTLVGTNNVWSEQGDIELSYHIPITNLLVKRQDVDDVSGNWLTLYSQPVEQASDMDFTFIDFLNQYGKTYKYALVPLLTQTQSGVEVEVEGGYTVSDEVQSVFDGVFIVDSTGSQKCKANVGYGNVDMNQTVGTITPIGAKYPVVITNSQNQYHNGSISGTIVPDDYYFNGNLSRIDMVNKRNELEQFLTNKRVKIIKDWNSNIWLVMIMDNIDCSFDNNYGMGIVTFNANWLEIGDPTNQEDLQATGLVDVGGV